MLRGEGLKTISGALIGIGAGLFVMGLAYVMIMMDGPLWLTELTVGIFILYNVLSMYLMGKYQKEM